LHLGVATYGEIDASTGLSKRIDDYFKCLDFIMEYAISNKADFFLICGDAFNNPVPTPTILKMFASRLKKLTKTGIAVVMIAGNHDLPKTEGRVSPIEIYSEIGMDNFYYLSGPTYIDLRTKDKKKVRIFAVPYVHPIKTFNKQQNLKKEKKELTYEAVLKAYGEEYADCISKFSKIGKGDADYCILMSHIAVFGTSRGTEEPITLLGGEFALLPNVLHSDIFDYVALGHIHKHQCLEWKVPIIYSGSIEKSNFSEIDEKKGFVAVQVGNKLEWKFIELPTRKMVKIEVDATGIRNIREKIYEELRRVDIKDAIVKLIIKVSKKSRPNFDYSDIRRMMAGAFYVEPSYERVQEDLPTQMLFSEALSANDSLIRYLETLKNLSKKERSLLEKLGLEIIKEVEDEATE